MTRSHIVEVVNQWGQTQPQKDWLQTYLNMLERLTQLKETAPELDLSVGQDGTEVR